MPGFLLDAGSSVLCAHGGQAQATAPSTRVRVAGRPAITQASLHHVVGCSATVAGSPVPCATATWVVVATRVRSQGVPMVLQDSQAVCAPNGTGVVVTASQDRVKGV